MALRLDDKFIKPFITDEELATIAPEVDAAAASLRAGTGKGSEMLGWLTLPENYDKEEFARIKAAAEKIKKSCDVFIVIGIGGSYLGSQIQPSQEGHPRYLFLGLQY